jgi:small subunit ribosomal protein S18
MGAIEKAAPEEEIQTTGAETAPSEVARAKPRRYGRRRRVCPICADSPKVLDYKDFAFLRRFISDRGRIEQRRRAGTCAKHQRALAQAIKRARHLALLPFTVEHLRRTGAPTSR